MQGNIECMWNLHKYLGESEGGERGRGEGGGGHGGGGRAHVAHHAPHREAGEVGQALTDAGKGWKRKED